MVLLALLFCFRELRMQQVHILTEEFNERARRCYGGFSHTSSATAALSGTTAAPDEIVAVKERLCYGSAMLSRCNMARRLYS